jgi:acyl-CoA synthetase (NDP forming)
MNEDNKEANLTKELKIPELEYIFRPRSIAIVGASPDPSNYATKGFLNPLIQFGYQGMIYPIHPKASEVLGLRAYPNILNVPGPVDHVICIIKAALVPQLMRECVAKGVKVIQLFTAGFSETGEEEGIRLEGKITEIARQGGVRVIGPNCLGIYCPGSRISFDASFPKQSGGVGFFSQSGGNSVELVQFGDARGVRFSKVVNFGNASDLNEADFTEYFAYDPQTEVIVGYIEGTKDGRRFINVLREAARAKPVIVVKGGITEGGAKAVASHTGALAGNNAVWNSLFRQFGVIQVYDLEELIDLLLLFQHLKPLKGRRIGLVGTGGGRSVLATDSCEREGLSVPPFSEAVRKKLRELVPEKAYHGISVRNPVDSSGLDWNPDIFSKILKTVADYDGLDFILTYTRVTFGTEKVAKVIDSLTETKKNLDKPIAMVVRHSEEPKTVSYAFEIQNRCHQAGIPTFPSFSRAARAISKFIQYHERRQQRNSNIKIQKK